MRFLRRLVQLVRYGVGILFLLIIAWLYFYNDARVTLLFPGADPINAPGYSVYLAFLLAGAFLMWLPTSANSLRKSLEIRRHRRQLREFGVDTRRSDELVARPPVDVRDPNQ